MSNIQNFFDELKKVENGNFLTSERRISSMLKALTECPQAYDILQLVSRDFELISAMEECFSFSPPALPKDEKRVIALVVGLLLKIDQKEIDFKEMLLNLYGENDDPYKDFCFGFISPLIAAFNKLVTEEFIEQPPVGKEELLKLRMDITALLPSAREKLLAMPDGVQLRELFYIFKGFSNAVKGEDVVALKCLWIGLKNTAGVYGFYPTELEEIEKLLQSFGVTE